MTVQYVDGSADADANVNIFNNQHHDVYINSRNTEISSTYDVIEDAKVVGVFVSYAADNNQTGLFISHNKFVENNYNYYEPASLLLKTSGTNKSSETIIDELYDNGFVINNEFIPYFLEYANVLSRYSSLITIGTIVWLVLVAILLYSFMSNSIRNSKRQIGILKALGANKADIYKIFSIEAVIIGLVSTIGGVLIYSIGGLIANQVITDVAYTFYFPFFINNVYTMLMMIIPTIIILTLSLIIPISKADSIKPIEVMNRE